MKKLIATSAFGLLCLTGCPSSNIAPGETGQVLKGGQPDGGGKGGTPIVANSPVLATVNGQQITRADITDRMMQHYGLDLTLHAVQLEMAKQRAKQAGVTVSAEDMSEEWKRQMAMMLPEAEEGDYENLLNQVLSQKGVLRPAFDMWLETTAYLRKILEPTVNAAITEDALKQAFMIQYGGKVKVRHVQSRTAADAAVARSRVLRGDDFGAVAKELSTNELSRGLGGELPAISMTNPNYPDNFKNAAFALKEGEVSEVISDGTNFHVIKVDKRIEPNKAMEFKTPAVQQMLRGQVRDALMANAMNELRRTMGLEALKAMEITDATLRDQYAERLRKDREKEKGKAEVSQEIEAANRGKGSATTKPAGARPGTNGGNGGLGEVPTDLQPAGSGKDVRPPATRPGE